MFSFLRTKIVCTIGPASMEPKVIEALIQHGMSVARLNLAHGDFETHSEIVSRIREAARRIGHRVAILADLPGPKFRVGRLPVDPLELRCEEDVILTVGTATDNPRRIPMNVPGFPGAICPGDSVFLSDGFIELRVKEVREEDIYCTVVTGGTLRSHKGINLPGIDLGVGVVTPFDRECLAFAAREGIDAISVSYVERVEDILDVRNIVSSLSYDPFVIAKIERGRAVENIDSIIEGTNGIMVARGDLGVETPIEEIAFVQKLIIKAANRAAKPVITATQMLESMIENRRPTRAEVTDVANAILDGTDCVMLSEETAMGRYPVDAVSMIARIAAATEREYSRHTAVGSVLLAEPPFSGQSAKEVMALAARIVAERLRLAALVIPTRSGTIARRLARFRLPVPILAMSTEEQTCQRLQFSFGTTGILLDEFPHDWADFCRSRLPELGVSGDLVVLAQGPSTLRPQIPHRIDVIDLAAKS